MHKRDRNNEIARLREAIGSADAIVIGAGAGISAAAGLTYAGERFERLFADFVAKYRFRDMYTAGFYPFSSLEEHWAVGPIANGNPTNLHRAQLASCYTNCLGLAASEGLASIAFCCISTGVFGFPQREAAQIAVRTVKEWLGSHDSEMRVVFNVFSESDERIYRELLGLQS